MSDLLGDLERAGGFSAIDVELARTLCQLAGETASELSLAVALASREVQAGHVCADLTRLAGRSALEEGESCYAFPELAGWLAALRRSTLVSLDGLSDPARPLILDSAHRLYLARYYDHEQQVAEALGALAAAEPSEPTERLPEALLERLFPAPQGGARDLQREAALAARKRRLTVIVGGPGTGKTSTVVKLLALLVHDAVTAGRAPPRTLLVAPTGKAAQRLSETIERALERLPVSDDVKRAIETRASTLHRALGPSGGSLTRFRHGREQPLDCDVVLLDEASMVDLALMRRFLEAIPARARVIMLGDPDQLASVEAGGVLHDMCRAAEHDDSPLARCVSRLTHSHRYAPDSGIAALAQAVHAQAIDEVLAVVRAGLPDVVLHAPPKPQVLGRALEREAREHYAGLRDPRIETRIAALERFRVLCAHRTGATGVEQLNPLLSRALGKRALRRTESYAGRPIIITENDYATSLFNGDVGVMHAESTRAALSACFRVGSDLLRHISIARLPAHESAYAMTIHKSQGSEFDHVAIVLPEHPSRLLSRELLYTAITRAKHSVSIYATEAALRACALARVQRSSGLADRLTPRER